jgi:hypothetical protein
LKGGLRQTERDLREKIIRRQKAFDAMTFFSVCIQD